MNITLDPPQTAWEVLTPRGVAAFARASSGRLLLVQFIVASIAAAVIVWFVHEGWFSAVREGIRQLPAQGAIREGILDWPREDPAVLSKNVFLSFTVDLDHSGEIGRDSHIAIEFGRHEVRVFSLFGYFDVKYSQERGMVFNRTELEPWWGAWQPAIMAAIVVLVIAGLMISWMVLGTLYTVPLWLIAFFENRDLSFKESWRLASACLMPGALFLSFAIFCYGINIIDLPRLCLSACLHIFLGWIYLFVSPLFLAKIGDSLTKGNPFKANKKNSS